MEDDKKRRSLISYYGETKGNRLADELEGVTKPEKPSRRKKKDEEDE